MHYFTPVLVSLFAFSANLPMGYWRSISRKFSTSWFLAVHLSVPVIVLIRLKMGLGYYFIPLFIMAAFAGQIMGGKWFGKLFQFSSQL